LSSLRIADHQRQKRPVGRWVFRSLLVAVVLVAALALVSRFRGSGVQVTVAAAQAPGSGAADAPTLLNASGYVTPRRRATVAAKITGKVTQIYIDEGMKVQQGQVLAQLDDSDYQVALASAKADAAATGAARIDLNVQLAQAQRELTRSQQLAESGIQTAEALDTARTAVKSLQAKIDLANADVVASEAKVRVAEQSLENCKVRAPFSGLVVSKDAQPGEMVSPISAGGGFTRTGIATIVDMASLEIEVDVNENYIARVKPGMRVEATLDAYPDWHIPGRVRTVIPTADREKGTVKVRATFDQLDPRILPDMGVKLAFLGDQPRLSPSAAAIKPVAIIPASAVRSANHETVVFVMRDGVLERRAIRVGPARGDQIDVLAGLSPGDLVVTGGPDDLRDGQAAEAKPSDSAR
jgi:RND family efflux transporter MFP subunit